MNALGIIIMSDLIMPYLWLSRSCAWTSSRRLPTWLTTRPWRTPLFLESNQPAFRPPRLLWVSISLYLSGCLPMHRYNLSVVMPLGVSNIVLLLAITIVYYHLKCYLFEIVFFAMHVILPCCVGTSELSGVSGEDFGVSRQVVCHWWDPALPTTDPLQRTSSTHGYSR